MIKKLKVFERAIIFSLMLMMMFVVFISTVRLGWWLVKEIINPPFLMFNTEQLFLIFGFFLMILIGLELLDSLKVYLNEDKIHVEVVFTIALIAVARKVITLDLTKIADNKLMGIAATIVSLAVGYYLIKKAHTIVKPK
ncbi:MAG: phosphate-starvation-inducible E-like protein [Candidatus Scalindua sp. AMX11]|nr:MAG: phosphate-starvation-inducible E-like protein [Candidatus Scalindua sp.]NOG84725.1 phosphate-starvation-inducible PsiE family protein [Planctomycetota bacterium]RZV98435.1 MAG: phosphate-starvation-inducible E-like protein [Candidatus Scalindua sp. SCAELEC01]TDE66623.1 MAG: phosphate-starvation-inducible E-like protein [Candidatus Scalindua sp. AMX11]